jgi:hypothetical protein
VEAEAAATLIVLIGHRMDVRRMMEETGRSKDRL